MYEFWLELINCMVELIGSELTYDEAKQIAEVRNFFQVTCNCIKLETYNDNSDYNEFKEGNKMKLEITTLKMLLILFQKATGSSLTTTQCTTGHQTKKLSMLIKIIPIVINNIELSDTKDTWSNKELWRKFILYLNELEKKIYALGLDLVCNSQTATIFNYECDFLRE